MPEQKTISFALSQLYSERMNSHWFLPLQKVCEKLETGGGTTTKSDRTA